MVYPGRFQPMLKHHAEVYQRLVNEYPDAEVYIGTSDKVEPGKSPFNFAEKQKIAQAHGIDSSRVLQVKNPYHMDSYPFDKDNTQVIFAVGEKDAEQRFPVNQTKKDGTPGYYQRLGSDDEPLPMSKRGYIAVAPNVTDGGDVASASAFRHAMQGARSPEEAKQIYTKQFGKYNPDVFNLIYDKVADKTMEQLDLNHMRRMAGLSEAPADRLKSNYYGMSDQQRQLADIGRALMNAQFKTDNDEESNKLSLIGSELTRFGAEEGASSLEDLMRKAKISSQEELLKYMKMGKDMVARGEHEMGAQGAGSDDVEKDDDEFDADADATAAVDDMDIEDEMDETTAGSVAMVPSGKPKDPTLDLNDIRGDYGIEEETGAENTTDKLENIDVVDNNQSFEEEDSYDTAILELAKLAGIATHDTNVAEIKGQVDPQKGENVGFGTVDKTDLDPIVDEEVMDDTFIAKKVQDMGATLDDQRDFIKHLAHVAKELKLGKYVMDNPDFVPDVMMAFKNLDEDEGCPCCGDGPCNCVSDCAGCDCGNMEEIAPAIAAVGRGVAKGVGAVAKGVGSMAKSAGSTLAINKMQQEINDEEANEDTVYAEDDSLDLLDLFDLDDQDTDEAIGDGFLSGNKALGAAMQDIEDEVTETPESALEATIKELRALAGL